MNKTWNETAIEMIGTIKIDNEGKIESTCRQFDKTVKYTVTLKVADETPWGVLGGENTWVYVDGLGQDKMDSLNALKAAGKLDRTTRIVFKGHLVRTPGKPGMNDLYNLKFMKARPAAEDESITVNFEEALTKNEWQVICAERKAQANGTAVSMTAPTAPVAPSVPF